ncbi:MAG: efflux RND transporter periplasmic adaptor subunit [Lentisphaeria bacterium]|nr:efflux RND transporter periplasmic adaptor subunit [Lentisphaeria bacterium]
MKRLILYVLLPLLLTGGGIWWGVEYFRTPGDAAEKPAGESKDLDRTFVVTRGELTLGLRLGGSVSASKKHKMALEANYRTKLLWVIEENAQVKKGDLLARFETDEPKEKIDDLTTSLSNTEKELVVAKENAVIQEQSNLVDLKVAEDRLTQAESALRKYLRLERSSSRQKYDLAISTADTNLLTARQNYDDTKKEIDEAGVTDQKQQKENEKNLRDLNNKIETAENALANAQTDRKAFKRYDDPIKLQKLENELEQARLNMQKVTISTKSNLVQKNKQVDNLSSNIRRIRNQLEKYQSYVPLMELKAPEDGIVIYGDPDRRWGNDEIKIGMDVSKGHILLTIPEMSNLMVDFDLPESYRSKTKAGDRVIISPDSLPGVKFEGMISRIATLPVNQIFWDDSSPKIYRSRITLDQQDPRLVNGMTVQLDVVSEVLKNVLFIPVEAVFEDDSRFFVYRNVNGSPEEVDVKIGRSNDNFVEITDGLKDGDIVYLYRPYQKKQSED